MDWGMENRLNQLMPNGKCFFMPIDHGYFQGPTSGLENPGKTIAPLLPYFDALFCEASIQEKACAISVFFAGPTTLSPHAPRPVLQDGFNFAVVHNSKFWKAATVGEGCELRLVW